MNDNKLKIRKLEFADIPELVKYRINYLVELQKKEQTDGNELLQNQLEEYFIKMKKNDQAFGFVAEENGELLSFGMMIIKEIPGDFKQPTYLEGDILNMYTIPKARKKGISSLILEKLIDEAQKRRISKIALHASKDGENMYRKFGFAEPEYPYLERILNIQNFTH